LPCSLAKSSLKVLDYDQLSRNNTVGIVYIDLNPLIADNGLQQVGGWFPIYDTLKYGPRGSSKSSAYGLFTSRHARQVGNSLS